MTRTYYELLRKPWTSLLCENRAHQLNRHYSYNLRNFCNNGSRVHYVLEMSICWGDTPQGRPYWERIRNQLARETEP